MPKKFPVNWFQKKLIDWYLENFRPLPWRETKDPYRIWISEIMLQQTQVKTVYPYFLRFIERFPSVGVLANAPAEQVMKCWEGLGYYRRAMNLHTTAQIIQNKFHGYLPENYQQLLDLPGIGPYTAGAIASFAFNLPQPAIDGNVSRVISRIFLIGETHKIAATQRKIRKRALEIISRDNASVFNQAIMELGATICTPQKAACGSCPVFSCCKAFKFNKQESIPNLGLKANPKKIVMEMALLAKQNKILLVKRSPRGLLANMWALPSTEKIKGCSNGISIQNELKKKYQINISKDPDLIGEENHVFTHRIWRMKLYHFSSFSDGNFNSSKEKWVSISQLNQYAIPTAFKKLFSLMDSNQKKIFLSHMRKGFTESIKDIKK